MKSRLITGPIAVLVVDAASIRIEHLARLVPSILRELNHAPPRTLRRVVG
jgi:hypothetical protein